VCQFNDKKAVARAVGLLRNEIQVAAQQTEVFIQIMPLFSGEQLRYKLTLPALRSMSESAQIA
jgi:hypothetical protein